MRFKGIDDQAPIASEGEQEIPMGIGGVGCSMRFQRLKNSRTPLLLSIGQLQSMGAKIDLVTPQVEFSVLGCHNVPITFSDKGHPMILVNQWPDLSRTEPRVKSDEVDIWEATPVEVPERGILGKKTMRQLEKMEKQLEKRLLDAQSALESVKLGNMNLNKDRTLVAELYCGKMECSVQAQHRGHNITQPHDIAFGDDR